MKFSGHSYFPQRSLFGIQLIASHLNIRLHRTIFPFSTLKYCISVCKYVITICPYFRVYSTWGLDFFQDTHPLEQSNPKTTISSYCYQVQAHAALHTTGQFIERWVAGARNSQQTERWWAHAPKNHLARVRIQASFILKGEGAKSNISCFRSASGRDVLISPSLQSFTGGPGQDVSCELNKGVLA